jgi:hypothetical protein
LIAQQSQNTRIGTEFSMPNRPLREWHFRLISGVAP